MLKSSILVSFISKTWSLLLVVKFGGGTAGVELNLTTMSVPGDIGLATISLYNTSEQNFPSNSTHLDKNIKKVYDTLTSTHQNETEQNLEHFENNETKVLDGKEFGFSTQLVILLAQCRAMCLDKFGDGESRYSLIHLLQTNRATSIFTCWNTCQLLEEHTANAKDQYNVVCSTSTNDCLNGCQEACDFHLHQPENILQSHPVALPVESALTISTSQHNLLRLTWPIVQNEEANIDQRSRGQRTMVYSLVKYVHTNASSSWNLIGEQTLTNEISLLMAEVNKASDLRLLAVNSHGLTHVYACSNVTLDFDKDQTIDSWHFRVTSLIHQKFLVMTEVRWDFWPENQTLPAGRHPGTFLLTWEVYGGLVRGHLVTESNVVTISLWPDTSYILQVGLIDEREVKVEKGKSITTQLEAIFSAGDELPVKHKSSTLQINTTLAIYQLVKESSQEWKRSTEDVIPGNDTHPIHLTGMGSFTGERSSSHFCHWNFHHHPNPTDDEVRGCRLIWAILIVCLLLIFLMFLYFSVAVYLAMQKQIYFQKLHRSCSVSSIYSRQFYRLKKSIFKRKHYPLTNQHKATFTSSALELLPLSDSSNSSDSEGDELAM